MRRSRRDENIFYSYRGGAADDAARERQLEDNVTKAFIGTLRHVSSELARNVMEALVPAAGTRGKLGYALQNNLPRGLVPARRARRVVLGIVPSDARDPSAMVHGTRESVTGSRRPDAWIWNDDLAVLVESKVKGHLDHEQWAGHRALLTLEGRGPDDAHRTWGDVHAAFSRARSLEPAGSKDAWLVDQFLAYLEVTGMAGFSGMGGEFFDLFHGGALDEEARDWIRETIKSLALALEPQLKTVAPFYEHADVGNISSAIGGAQAWIAFGPADYRNVAHQTFAVGADGIHVFVNVELKSAVDRLRSILARDPMEFRRRILAIGAEDDRVTIEVKERVRRQVQLYDYHPLLRIDMRALLDERLREGSFDYLTRTLSEVPLPNLEVRTRIDRTTAEALSTQDRGRALLAELLVRMRRFHPLVEWSNAA